MKGQVWAIIPACLALLGASSQSGVQSAVYRTDVPSSEITTADLVWRGQDSNIYLDAADVELKAQVELIQAQYKNGVLSKSEYERLLRRYREAQQENLRLASTPNSGKYTQFAQYRIDGVQQSGGESFLAGAKLAKGKDGSIVVETASLRRGLRDQVFDLKGAFKQKPDSEPAISYLDSEFGAADARLATAGPTIRLADAIQVSEPMRYMASMLDSSGSMLELDVQTIPAGATVIITSGGTYRSEMTSNTKTRLLRGQFSYTVSKAGYKDVTGSHLNLVAASAESRFVCTLIKIGSKQRSQPCNLQ